MTEEEKHLKTILTQSKNNMNIGIFVVIIIMVAVPVIYFIYTSKIDKMK